MNFLNMSLKLNNPTKISKYFLKAAFHSENSHKDYYPG